MKLFLTDQFELHEGGGKRVTGNHLCLQPKFISFLGIPSALFLISGFRTELI